jgi:hypothetical protein
VSARHPYWPDLTDDEGDALAEWFDDTCGDCIEGRCHYGGEESRRSEEAVARGEDYVSPKWGRCGCSHHRASIAARPYRNVGDTPQAAALAWRDAKAAGTVVVEHD